MIKRKSQIIRILAVVAVILVTLLGALYIGKDLAPDSSSALFGGKLESGYPFAGYSIGYQNGKVTTCGVTFLNESTAVTAAHCLPGDAEIYIGVNEFKPNRNDNIKVGNYVVNTGWAGKPENDIAVLNLSSNVNLEQYAVTAEARKSCNYEIVGYGQNENTIPGDYTTKLRKSIQVCIEDIIGNVAYMKGLDGGICYGDSGSPVFEKGTNRLVGIVSSIISSSKDKSSYCAVNNIGAVVVANTYQSFILASQFTDGQDQKATRSVCGSSCITNSDCLSGLSCQNRVCVSDSASCDAGASAYCAPSLNINCISGNSCIGNVCINNSELAEEEVSEVLYGINPLIVAILLAAVLFAIVVLLLIPNRNRAP